MKKLVDLVKSLFCKTKKVEVATKKQGRKSGRPKKLK